MCASMYACVCMCVRLCGPASFGKEETNPTYKTKVLFQSVRCSNVVLRPHIGSLFAHCFPSSSHPAIPNDPIFQFILSPSDAYLPPLISRSGCPQPCPAASPFSISADIPKILPQILTPPICSTQSPTPSQSLATGPPRF